MFNYKSTFAVLAVSVLTSCAVTQPRAPLYDELVAQKPATAAAKPVKPQYKTVQQEVKHEKKVYHTVKKGEYIYAIARKYKMSPFTLMKNNNLTRDDVVQPGTRLYIRTDVTTQVVNKKVQVKEPSASSIKAQAPQGYSLTRNKKLYNQNTPEYRETKTLPRQDLSKPNTDENVDFGYHKVRRGENLFRIGKKYGVSVFDLMAYNDIKSAQSLKAGQELKIPVAKPQTAAQEPVAPSSDTPDVTLKFDKIDKDLARKKGFIRPVDGKIISTFGKKGHGIRNDGIDIAVKIGTPVRASQSGTIMYAENVSVLGNMVLIKHRSGYISAYTHNSKLLVRKGKKVSKGEIIALSGDSGNAKQPMLHFEIRRYGKAINPTKLIK